MDKYPDLSRVLKHLNRATERGRRRLANDPDTIAFLDAGLSLIADELGVGIYGPSTADTDNVFFSWLTVPRVIQEANKDGPELTYAMHRDRWATRSAFFKDLMAFALWSQHWETHTRLAQHSSNLLTGEDDIVEAIMEVAYDDLDSLVDAPGPRIAILLAAMAARDEPARSERSDLYAKTTETWSKLYADTLAARGWKFRPDVSLEEFTVILAAAAEGLALRAIGDPRTEVINHKTRASLLGKLALMMAVACLDPGDGKLLEEVLRARFS